MSAENVLLTRSGMEALNRRDLSGWLSYLDPDVEMLPTGGVAVETPVFRGHDEVAAWFTELPKIWDAVQIVECEIRDLGESTLWLGRVKLRGAASGVELDQEWAMHFVWANHKVVRATGFRSWIDAERQDVRLSD